MQNQSVQQFSQSAHTRVHCDPEWVELQQQLGFTLLLGTRSMGDLHVVSAGTPGSLNFHVVKFPL